MNNEMCATLCSNSLSYEGIVSITLSIKGHKYPFVFKNSGTKHLFNTITRALAGYPISGHTPSRIDIQQQSNTNVYTTCLKNPIPLTGIVYGEPAGSSNDTDSRLLLNAVITNEDRRPLGNLIKPRIAILDDNENVLAQITSDQIQYMWEQLNSPETEVLIEWAMIFTNKEK